MQLAHVPKFQKAYANGLPVHWKAHQVGSLLSPQNHMHAVQQEKRHLQCSNRNQRQVKQMELIAELFGIGGLPGHRLRYQKTLR